MSGFNASAPKAGPLRFARAAVDNQRSTSAGRLSGATPYRVGDESAFIGANPVFNMDEEPLTAADVKELFRIALGRYVLPVTPEDVRRELGGHDLACWCPLDSPCHADVLLELANRLEGD